MEVKETFLCTFCGKGFTKKANLESHITLHTGEKRYHCTQCDKKFRSHSVYQVQVPALRKKVSITFGVPGTQYVRVHEMSNIFVLNLAFCRLCAMQRLTPVCSLEPPALPQGKEGVYLHLLRQGLHAEVAPTAPHGHTHRREEPRLPSLSEDFHRARRREEAHADSQQRRDQESVQHSAASVTSKSRPRPHYCEI